VTSDTFASWAELLTYVEEKRGPVRYHAPLDIRPAMVRAERRGKKVRVFPFASDCDSFTADAGHLDRFRRGLS
jgi:hypothetical protein